MIACAVCWPRSTPMRDSTAQTRKAARRETRRAANKQVMEHVGRPLGYGPKWKNSPKRHGRRRIRAGVARCRPAPLSPGIPAPVGFGALDPGGDPPSGPLQSSAPVSRTAVQLRSAPPLARPNTRRQQARRTGGRTLHTGEQPLPAVHPTATTDTCWVKRSCRLGAYGGGGEGPAVGVLLGRSSAQDRENRAPGRPLVGATTISQRGGTRHDCTHPSPTPRQRRHGQSGRDSQHRSDRGMATRRP